MARKEESNSLSLVEKKQVTGFQSFPSFVRKGTILLGTTHLTKEALMELCSKWVERGLKSLARAEGRTFEMLTAKARTNTAAASVVILAFCSFAWPWIYMQESSWDGLIIRCDANLHSFEPKSNPVLDEQYHQHFTENRHSSFLGPSFRPCHPSLSCQHHHSIITSSPPYYPQPPRHY